MIVAMVAGSILIAVRTMTFWSSQRCVAAPAALACTGSTASRAPADDVLEATDTMRAFQQETVDQLQVIQDQLAAQRVETKKLADELPRLPIGSQLCKERARSLVYLSRPAEVTSLGVCSRRPNKSTNTRAPWPENITSRRRITLLELSLTVRPDLPLDPGL
jgi:hypothetical protein